MYRYGREYGAWTAYDPPRHDPSYGRPRGDWGGPGRGRYLEEAREPWAPTRQGGGAGRGRGAPRRAHVADIMTPDPQAVTADTSLMEVARRMRELDIGIIPVVDDEGSRRLEGVITDRDITVRAAAEGRDMKSARAYDYMTTEVHTVHESDPVQAVFAVMKRDRVRRVPVTDDDGRLVGIVAQADLVVDYAGVDLEREAEVEEVIERISEPGGRGRSTPYRGRGRSYDRDLADRVRDGWDYVRREARHFLDRG